MLPVETIFPAGKQNSEIPHSSQKSRPRGGSVIEVCCEVFLSKKQQGRTGNSSQITVKSAETELLLYPAAHQQGPSNCSAVKYCSTKLSYFWNFPYIQKIFSQKVTTYTLLAGAACPLHSHLQPDCGITLGRIKMQRGL